MFVFSSNQLFKMDASKNTRKRSSSSSQKTVSGYVLNVSPMKSSKKTSKPYFNLDFETEEDVKHVVCFSPSKRRLFESARNERHGCEIDNATIKDSNTIFVSDYSTIRHKELGFPITNAYAYKTVGAVINEVPLGTNVNMHGVVDLDDARYVTVNNDEVRIREGYLIDDTGHIKITLWREYANVESGKTNDFLHLMKMKYAGEIAVQSVNTTAFTLSEDQIVDFDAPERSPPSQLNGSRILAITSTETHNCTICQVAVMPGQENLFKCRECSSVMLKSTLNKKSMKKFTISSDAGRTQVSCHDSLIQAAFPNRVIADMDSEQLSLLLLSQRFNIGYEESTGNITTLMPLLD